MILKQIFLIYDSQANIFNMYMILEQIFLIYDSQANIFDI